MFPAAADPGQLEDGVHDCLCLLRLRQHRVLHVRHGEAAALEPSCRHVRGQPRPRLQQRREEPQEGAAKSGAVMNVLVIMNRTSESMVL